MKCAATMYGSACAATDNLGIGWLAVVTPDGKRYWLCPLHKLGGEVSVLDVATEEPELRMSALRRLAARESARDAQRQAEADAPPKPAKR